VTLGNRVRRGSPDERGAFLVVWALMLVAVVVMVGFVVDLGSLRSAARRNQSVADLAALAAAKNLGTGNHAAACQDAINYLNINAPNITAINAANFCSQVGNNVSQTVCSPPNALAQARPTITSGSYTVSVHFPVPDSELADARFTGPGLNDGTPCQRMRVIVTSGEPVFFGGVVGAHGLSATRSATVHAGTGTQKKVPALWLLDPYGCVSLKASGGSRLSVGVTTPSTIPGIIAIDSDGTDCNSNQTTVSASGNNTVVQAVPASGTPAGELSLFALETGAATCSAPACDAGDVAAGRLIPQPVSAGERATRAPVDWRYNCKSGYPAFHGIAIANCGAATPPYIDNLKTTVGASGNPSPTYQRWTTTGHSCNPSGTTTVTGNWWVDCSGGLSIGNGTTVTFSGGNVVFDGGLSMTGGALNFNSSNPAPTLTASCRPPNVTTPCINTSSSGAALVYVRAGDWNITGGVLNANHVAVYQAAGYLKVAGGAPPIWHAPTEGPFASLALWSEQTSNKFQMNGGAGVQLSGVFFTPEATPFSLAGGGNWGQLDAQFISYQLAVSGGGSLAITPDPVNFISLPPRAGVLIR
jgi:Flp pilus assembly protein TadG